MVDSLFYKRQWEDTEPQVTCPACSGKKILCLPCRNKGTVPASRACGICGNWITQCTCPRQPRAVLSGKLEPRPRRQS